MPLHHLIVSVPPHPQAWHVEPAATALGLSQAEARVLVSYAAPEIWYASPDDAEAEDKYDEIGRTRLRVVFTDTSILGRIPARAEVRSFQVAKAGIVWNLTDERTVEMPFRTRVLLVYGKPRTAASRPTAGAQASSPDGRSALQNPAFVEMYFEDDRRPVRLGIAPGIKFTGLGERMRSTFGGNCEALASLLREKLPAVHEDGRLMDLAQRQPRVAGAGLARVLEAIQPGGRGLEPLDLASRLVFLTSNPG